MNPDDYHKLLKIKNSEKNNLMKHSSVTDYLGYRLALLRNYNDDK